MNEILCHNADYMVVSKVVEPPKWFVRDGQEWCPFCGSCSPHVLINEHAKGTEFRMELADMKYGFPHKFYIRGIHGVIKFRLIHLYDLNNEDLEKFSTLLEEKTGLVVWRKKSDNLIAIGPRKFRNHDPVDMEVLQ